MEVLELKNQVTELKDLKENLQKDNSQLQDRMLSLEDELTKIKGFTRQWSNTIYQDLLSTLWSFTETLSLQQAELINDEMFNNGASIVNEHPSLVMNMEALGKARKSLDPFNQTDSKSEAERITKMLEVLKTGFEQFKGDHLEAGRAAEAELKRLRRRLRSKEFEAEELRRSHRAAAEAQRALLNQEAARLEPRLKEAHQLKSENIKLRAELREAGAEAEALVARVAAAEGRAADGEAAAERLQFEHHKLSKKYSAAKDVTSAVVQDQKTIAQLNRVIVNHEAVIEKMRDRLQNVVGTFEQFLSSIRRNGSPQRGSTTPGAEITELQCRRIEDLMISKLYQVLSIPDDNQNIGFVPETPAQPVEISQGTASIGRHSRSHTPNRPSKKKVRRRSLSILRHSQTPDRDDAGGFLSDSSAPPAAGGRRRRRR
eukprot:CAMPEP_0194740078 /NCGR_PEP_ID=MMETSP0296-20130528/91010_1 /TAXON_ID=39354 /ORGANISM="Heterosigma akashiwo, Strain CCMP2393" /LENGTH=428 /DNA_ID=CAMNT_0039651073 /DNA_START=111 /DNA_END=1393 /DNA_ORIENTATION=-